MNNRIYNRANAANSLQISIMGKVEAVAEFLFLMKWVVKNLSY